MTSDAPIDHTSVTDSDEPDLRAALARFLPTRRWFAGKGRAFDVTHVASLDWLDDGEWPRTRVELVTVRTGRSSKAATTDCYQLPVSYFADEPAGLEHALIGVVEHEEIGRVYAYDAVFVRAATDALLAGFRPGGATGSMRFHLVDGVEVPHDVPGAVMSAEQSNTSIVYGDDAILKLFRRVSAGQNPDIEIHDALTRAGSGHVAPLFGWLSATWYDDQGAGHEGDLGMLQSFLRTASDGWDLALASLRDLLVEADLHPEEVGGDLAAESERLGEAVATVHRDLAVAFGSTAATADEAARIADAMKARLADALDSVPELAPYAAGLARHFTRLRSSLAPLELQRVHGDLHLGQTLRTAIGWKLIDFEGEPAKSLEERSMPSPRVRDVAGMLRSYAYAAGAALHEFGGGPQLAYRAEEWNRRNRDAFLTGYAMASGTGLEAQRDVIAAFEADKAVYEAVYEARHRPTWLAIPMQAIARIAAEE